MSTGTLLTVSSNITLTLQDITLKGRPGNNTVLVKVGLGGSMVMNQNAKISDNTSSLSQGGGGLCIDGGTVTMNDGEISGNITADKSAYATDDGGAGVFVTNSGVMVINGGKITGNSARYGGGINISDHSTVTMHGGEISNNTASAYGGGIYVHWRQNDNRFAKTSISADGKSGVIYGSSAGPGLANTANSGNGAAIHVNDSSKRRDDTLGQFDEY
jgi:hypothetical protein